MKTIFKKDLKTQVNELNSLIKAHEVVKFKENGLDMALSGSIYHRAIKLCEDAELFLYERDCSTWKVTEVKEEIEGKATVFSCEKGIAYIRGYLNL